MQHLVSLCYARATKDKGTTIHFRVMTGILERPELRKLGLLGGSVGTVCDFIMYLLGTCSVSRASQLLRDHDRDRDKRKLVPAKQGHRGLARTTLLECVAVHCRSVVHFAPLESVEKALSTR